MEFTRMIQSQMAQRFACAHYSGMTPGERFARLRKAKGFGQLRLANLAGMKSDQAVSNFEQGKSDKMQPDNWLKIAQALGMSLNELNDAVYGNVVIMTIPAALGDAVQQLVNQFESSVKSATSPRQPQSAELDLANDSAVEVEVGALPDRNERRDDNQGGRGAPGRKDRRPKKSPPSKGRTKT